ncbi:TetR/AcrR family transcriptional regulator [Vitiosangium sp. GDMCC 1.1324]|uniref:TetR/AcrR family transcriptional regulator n=1 Tax=Vitiosangium sp. (strain GDMCC 1.1324) TaxID=2138576 RepID=UPI000D3A8294|nr:TetR/AcrR family transcriptional regulator [Vitiosangium sp. GDMCC 1.1324]PTL79240.1 TetR family transcriptional regulator [Vitiosangium sp. GDMCC 1.1324]
MQTRPSRREALLEAAARIVRRDGYEALSLDAVAAEAGLSKGGLLYHFPSKEALVAALVEQLVESFETAHADAAAAGPPGPGAWSRAYVRATLDRPGEEDAVSVAILAAVAMNPALLQPLRQRYSAWNEALRRDGLPGVDAWVVRLAVDGLWLSDLLGFEPPTGKIRSRVVARLLELAGGQP